MAHGFFHHELGARDTHRLSSVTQRRFPCQRHVGRGVEPGTRGPPSLRHARAALLSPSATEASIEEAASQTLGVDDTQSYAPAPRSRPHLRGNERAAQYVCELPSETTYLHGEPSSPLKGRPPEPLVRNPRPHPASPAHTT